MNRRKLLGFLAALLLCFPAAGNCGVMSWVAAAEASHANAKVVQLEARVAAVEAEQKKTNQLLQEILKKLNEQKKLP